MALVPMPEIVIDVFDENHRNGAVPPETLNCIVVPTARTAVSGVMAGAGAVAAVTVTVVLPEMLSASVAVTMVDPAARPVTTPVVVLMLATPLFVTVHVYGARPPVADIWSVLPAETDSDGAVTEIVRKVITPVLAEALFASRTVTIVVPGVDAVRFALVPIPLIAAAVFDEAHVYGAVPPLTDNCNVVPVARIAVCGVTTSVPVGGGAAATMVISALLAKKPSASTARTVTDPAATPVKVPAVFTLAIAALLVLQV